MPHLHEAANEHDAKDAQCKHRVQENRCSGNRTAMSPYPTWIIYLSREREILITLGIISSDHIWKQFGIHLGSIWGSCASPWQGRSRIGGKLLEVLPCFVIMKTMYLITPLTERTLHWQILTDIGQILTNINHILTKIVKQMTKTCLFSKGHVNKKKTPAALNNVANMGWGYQHWLNTKIWINIALLIIIIK